MHKLKRVWWLHKVVTVKIKEEIEWKDIPCLFLKYQSYQNNYANKTLGRSSTFSIQNSNDILRGSRINVTKSMLKNETKVSIMLSDFKYSTKLY